MPNVVYTDKIGGSEMLPATPGQPLIDVLRLAGIPLNSVLTRVNGELVSEEVVLIRPDDLVEIRQVRHYDSRVTRDPQSRTYADPRPVYTKSVLFETDGELERRSEQLDADRFVAYVEETFVQSVKAKALLDSDEEVVIGLSGGRDSVAFLELLERTTGAVPSERFVAVTITGLADWEEPATLDAARLACERLGIRQAFLDADDIAEVFHLNRPFAETMAAVVGGDDRSSTMIFGHQVLRRMLEVSAERRGARTIAFGFNADDLLASLVTWYTTGFQMGGIPVREIGPFRYVFPLFQITKKELTLYLELVAPELNRQGPPGRFTTGPGERSLAYAMADHLYTLWPGIDYYVFEAFERMQSYMRPPIEATCQVCGATMLVDNSAKAIPAAMCDVCDYFARHEMNDAR